MFDKQLFTVYNAISIVQEQQQPYQYLILHFKYQACIHGTDIVIKVDVSAVLINCDIFCHWNGVVRFRHRSV